MTDDRGGGGDPKGAPSWRALGLLSTIPLILGVAPIVGWWLGRWVDRRAGTDWAFQAVGVAIGLAAGIRETVLLIRAAQRDLDGPRRSK